MNNVELFFVWLKLYSKIKSTSWKLKSTSWNSKVRVKTTSYKFKSTSYLFKSVSYEFKSTSYEFNSTSYKFKSTRSRIIKSMKTQVNSLLKQSSKTHKIKKISTASNFEAVSGEKLLFYFTTSPWLRLLREAEWENINFERRDLNSSRKMIFEKIFYFFCF